MPTWAKHVTDEELLELAFEKQEQVGYTTVDSLVFAVRDKINFAYQYADVLIQEQLKRFSEIKLVRSCTVRDRFQKQLYRFPAYVLTSKGEAKCKALRGNSDPKLF